MFTKPFKIKSQTQLKGSDRKKLRTELSKMYPSLTAEDVNKLVPSKEDVTLIKMYCHRGESVNVYQVQKDPMFFMIEREKEIYPTVYMLWKYPDLLRTFTTQDPVIDVLVGGADLMLPGIVVKGQVGPTSYGKFEKGLPAAVNTLENKAPQAVGITAQSSMDMYMSARRGKGITILQVYRDHLWELGSKSPPPPMGPAFSEPVPQSAENLGSKGEEADVSDPANESGTNSPSELADGVEEIKLTDGQSPDSDPGVDVGLQQEEEVAQVSGPEAMDKLLVHCFLKAWKTSAKKVEVPILTSNFYRLHMVPACPDGASLDIKKSSYKKLTKFLNEMAKQEIIQVKEFPKGVENITAVNWAHDDLKSFVVDMEETTVKQVTNSGARTFTPPQIEEVYQVSGDTLQFYKANGLCKGDVLVTSEVRQVVTSYIKKKGLQKEGDRMVNLDPVLHEAVVNRKEGYKEQLRWDEIFSRMLGKMAPAIRITRPGFNPVIRKGKLEPIEINVAKRSGNKKVTLIYNANIYGIDEAEFAHQIQVGVAASTSVGPAEHKPQGTTQVLVQGNQVAFVSKLLLETYHIPRKYIRGMELAAKGKKK
ncbi:eukaryotic translation initiation factor 2D-like [Penaeus indicus]|uniref:eukaryotic translation initiation factor 2D-like n=1 Tax=Penaeus indicus TaxID=29960 RepID=UPI00300CC9F6